MLPPPICPWRSSRRLLLSGRLRPSSRRPLLARHRRRQLPPRARSRRPERRPQSSLLSGKEIEWIEANAFDLLKDYSSSDRHYDTIVLDPPAFAKSKRDLDAASAATRNSISAPSRCCAPADFSSPAPAPTTSASPTSSKCCQRGPRRPPDPASDRGSRPGQGSPRPAKCPRNRLFEVRHSHRKLMKIKHNIYIDSNTLIFYASFALS